MIDTEERNRFQTKPSARTARMNRLPERSCASRCPLLLYYSVLGLFEITISAATKTCITATTSNSAILTVLCSSAYMSIGTTCISPIAVLFS